MTRIFNCKRLHGSYLCPRFLANRACDLLGRLTRCPWDYDERIFSR